MIQNYQENFGILKRAMEHQKLPGKLSQYVICLLCLNEKYEIATYKEDNLFNKGTEIINTCRHRRNRN